MCANLKWSVSGPGNNLGLTQGLILISVRAKGNLKTPFALYGKQMLNKYLLSIKREKEEEMRGRQDKERTRKGKGSL